MNASKSNRDKVGLGKISGEYTEIDFGIWMHVQGLSLIADGG